MATFSPCHWHLTVQRLCPSLAPLPLFFSLLLCLSRVVLPRPLNYVALLGCSPGALLLNISFPFALFAGCLVCKMRRCQCQEFSHCVRNSCSSQTHTHTRHTLVLPCVCVLLPVCSYNSSCSSSSSSCHALGKVENSISCFSCTYVSRIFCCPSLPPSPLLAVVVVRFWHFCAWHCIRLAFACPA